MPTPAKSPLNVEIITVDIQSGDEIRRKTINYADSSDRKWFIGHMFWAAHNHFGIVFNPVH